LIQAASKQPVVSVKACATPAEAGGSAFSHFLNVSEGIGAVPVSDMALRHLQASRRLLLN